MKPQVVLNATSLEVTSVDWGDYPALFETDYQKIMQVHFWSPMFNVWVKLVPSKSGEATPGVVEVTCADVEAMAAFADSGVDRRAAAERVLGKEYLGEIEKFTHQMNEECK